MATIPETVVTRSSGVTTLTLGASANNYTFRKGDRQMIVLRNPTGGALSPLLIGDAAVQAEVPGASPRTTSAGIAPSGCPAGQVIIMSLDAYFEFLKGTLDVTGGTSMVGFIVAPHKP